MSEELKPCPFCGGEAVLDTRKTVTTHIEYENYRAGCHNCGIMTEWLALAEGKANVILTWNRRADDGQS